MSRTDLYTIGWICAVGSELVAATAFLDEKHDDPEHLPANDNNTYILGRIGKHNIAIAALTHGQYGLVSASNAARDLVRSFTNVRFGLMVGIGGAAPSLKHDIRLGDVVVSSPAHGTGGVLQYDYGKTIQDAKFVMTGHLNQPPQFLLTAISVLKAQYESDGHTIEEDIDRIFEKKPRLRRNYERPNPSSDRLFIPSFKHTASDDADCSTVCDDFSKLVTRVDRTEEDDNPTIHFGLIASANQLMKDATIRDKLSAEKDVLCFEMEAAGLMNHFPCLVIRGICDYSDTHKNKKWQGYAAMAAAAYAKDLLQKVAPNKVEAERKVADVISDVKTQLEDVRTGIDQVGRDTKNIATHMSSEEESKILEWLSSKDIDFSSLQNLSQQTHTAGTGLWLLDGRKYQDWRDHSPGLMWLHGAAGCGKTILCSTVIADLQVHVPNLAYWYFRFDDIALQDVSKMLRSIIRQLSCLPLTNRVRTLYDRHSQPGTKPSLEELTKVLDDTIATFKEDVYVVFDALDECPHQDKKGQRDQLLRCIGNLIKTNSNLHLFVTSRPEPDIRRELYKIANCSLDIEELVKRDVERYVKDALKEPRLASWSEEVKVEIRDKLLEQKERRFRWADLQIKRFAQCATLEKLRLAMATIPKDLETSYHDVFKAIDDDNAKDVATIMRWLTVSFEPLSASQIAAAVGFRNSDYVLDICSTLLVTIIDEDTTQIIKLAHFSVKEFLVVKLQESNTSWFQFSYELANKTVAVIALQALLKPGYKPGPLVYYAAKYWPQHATEGLKENEHIELEKQINLLFNGNNTEQFSCWLDIHDPDDTYGFRDYKRAGALYYASLLGFEAAVNSLWVADSQLLDDEGQYGNALNAAALSGNMGIFRWLLQKCHGSARFLNLVRIFENYQTCARECIVEICDSSRGLQITEEVVKAAAGNKFNGKKVMELLLEKRGDEVHITDEVVKAAAGNNWSGQKVMELLLEKKGDEVHITESVVKAAAGNSRSGQKVMKLLLEKNGDEVHITEEVVKAAAGNNWSGQEVLELLLEKKGDEVQITEEVVKAAAGNKGSGQKVMDLLLEKKGDEVHITEEVVKAAAGNSRSGQKVMELLLEKKGDEVHITEEVVKAAAGNNWSGQEVLELLLEKKGDEVQITEEVVKAAAGNDGSGQKVIELLLEKNGDEVRITEEVVKAAARNQNSGQRVMELLLERKGDEVQITEEVVKAAAGNEGSGQEVMELLLGQRGGDVQITKEVVALIAGEFNAFIFQLLLDKKGDEVQIMEEVVKAGAGNRRCGQEVMELLLERRGEEIKITQDVVVAAAENGRSGQKVMEILLKLGANLNAANEKGDTPLGAAASAGQLEVVKLLLMNGAEPAIADKYGSTPLNNASLSGYGEIVNLLLAEGCDSSISDNDGFTPLCNASYNGHEEVVTLLIKGGADVMIAENGWTPLSIASSRGHIAVVRALVSAEGIVIDARDGNGLTALAWAAKRGYEQVVDLLLERGANTAISDSQGATCINLAAREGHLEVVKRLLAHSFLWNVPDATGSDALQLAILGGHSHVEAHFLKLGAEIPDDVYGFIGLFETGLRGRSI